MKRTFKLMIKSFTFLMLLAVAIILSGCTKKVTLKEITIDTAPKTTFYVGEEFEPGSLDVSATYSDGKVEKVTDYKVDSSKVDSTKAGDYEVVVTYEKVQTSYTVHYISDPVTKIEVTGQKKYFEVGQEFTTGDMIVTAKHDVRGDIVLEKGDYTVDSSKVDSTKAGIYEVTVSYSGFTEKYNVEYTLIVDGFKLELNAEKTGYIVSEVEGYNYPYYVTIPAEYEGIPVVEIGAMTSLEASYVKVPTSVKVVSEGAFMGNQYISIIDFTGCSVEIKASAFYAASIYAAELGNATKIGEGAFKDSALEIVSIPATVTEIEAEAFWTTSLNEVSFQGEQLPTLGENVFGPKLSQEDYLYIYAQKTVWDKLFENVSPDSETAESEKAEIVINHFGVTYGAYLELTAEQVEYTGLYTGDAIIYQIAGDNLVIVIDDYAAVLYANSYKGVILEDERLEERYVFALDSATKTAERLTANEKGEYIKDTVLYDYTGTGVIYYVSDEVTEVAGGAGSGDGTKSIDTRFIIFGDNVTKIGMYAFSFGQLFGVTFGKNLTFIDEYAFFGQQYLQEIVFQTETAPFIGTAAFCYLGQYGLFPTPIFSGLEEYGIPCTVYVPRDSSSWWGDGFVAAYIEAFDQSLIGLDEIIVKDENGSPVRYSTSDVKPLDADDLYSFENVFTFEYGTIYMRSIIDGFVYVELNEGTYDEVGPYAGLAYASISDLVGYTGNESPKKMEILYKNPEDYGMRSFIVYGKFDLTEKTFTFRGDEAGTYGVYPNEIVELDGFGNITYFHTEKGQYTGTYEVLDNQITITGISVLSTLTFDKENKTISYEETTLPTMGAEAGVYFDIANTAKIELDGTAIVVQDVRYNGTLKLTYKGEEYISQYIIIGNKLKFMLGEVEKEWTYSKEDTSVITGYFDSSYNTYLKFKVTSSTGEHTYTNGTDTLILDGFFNASINEQKYYYMQIEGSDVVVLYTDTEAIFVTLTGETYSVNTDPEAGVYYMDSSASYRLYLAGSGVLLYFNGEAHPGKYTYNEETGEFIITEWNGSANTTSTNGILKDGFGYIVYYSYGDTFAVISKEPIEKAYASFIGYTVDGENISGQSYSTNVIVSGTNIAVNQYGIKPQLVKLAEVVDGTTFQVTLTDSKPIGATITITINHNAEGKLVVAITGPYETKTYTVGSDTYILNWIDENHEKAGFYKQESYPTIVCGTVTWNTEKTSFVLGEGIDIVTGKYNVIKVSNYGTESETLEPQSSSPIYYSSSSGLEYKYCKINVYNETSLWVENSNVDGASPEICEYTTTVVDGVTYYHFHNTANNMNVTFKIVATSWGTEFVVTEEVAA